MKKSKLQTWRMFLEKAPCYREGIFIASILAWKTTKNKGIIFSGRGGVIETERFTDEY